MSYHGAEYTFRKEWMTPFDKYSYDMVYVCGLEIEEPTGLDLIEYLESHPDWKIVKTENTAGAAKKVHEEMNRSQAAIASRAAGELYGLKILAENICYNGQNATRFVIVSKKPIYVKDAHKISIFFELHHESGTLYNMLSHIIYNGLNMTNIQSRPLQNKNWEYRFFVDFEGRFEDHAVQNALRGLRDETIAFRILGTY